MHYYLIKLMINQYSIALATPWSWVRIPGNCKSFR